MIEQSYPNKDAFPAMPAPANIVYIAADTTKRYFIASGAYQEFNPVPPSPQQPIIGA